MIDLPLAVLQTAVELGGEEGARVMDRALQRRVSLDELRRARSRVVGHRGVGEMCRLITLAGDRAWSALERLVIRLLTDAGIRGWEVNGTVALADRVVEVDILFRKAKVALELKGWAFRSDPKSVDADQDRENVLQIAGYLVLQISWWDAVKHPRRTLARIVPRGPRERHPGARVPGDHGRQVLRAPMIMSRRRLRRRPHLVVTDTARRSP